MPKLYSSKFQINIITKLEKYPFLLDFFSKLARKRATKVAEDLNLKKNIRREDKVLYIGAGTGHIAQLIATETKAKVIALDLEDLRTSDTKNIQFVQGNALNLPFKTNSFDVLTYVDMLHHCEQQGEILREAHRVLKSGGRLLVHEETVPSLDRNKSRILVKFLIGVVDDLVNLQPFGPNPYNFRSAKEWIKFIEGHGFRYSSRQSHNWGISDFLPSVLNLGNKNSRSVGRIFETTGFIFRKGD